MCLICEQKVKRLQDLSDGRGMHSDGHPQYLVWTECTAGDPCGGGSTVSAGFDTLDEFLEYLTLLPYVFGEGRLGCQDLANIHERVSGLVAAYGRCETPAMEAVAAVNEALRQTDIKIETMGSFTQYCSSPEPMFVTFREDAREERLQRGDSQGDGRAFDAAEVGLFEAWLEGGGYLLGESFNFDAADESNEMVDEIISNLNLGSKKSLQYWFAHEELPWRVRLHPDRFYQGVSGNHADAYLRQLWKKLSEGTEGWGVVTPPTFQVAKHILDVGVEAYIIHLPQPKVSPEALFAAAIFWTGNSQPEQAMPVWRYFTWDLGSDITGVFPYCFCEWDAQGNHFNRGVHKGSSEADFLTVLKDFLKV
ncbi:MAG: hypothetical protein PHQ40_03550 [Anaerolineaceae bacterium]|nr:hypothetical protein [Anaerolineaceae bacterium]